MLAHSQYLCVSWLHLQTILIQLVNRYAREVMHKHRWHLFEHAAPRLPRAVSSRAPTAAPPGSAGLLAVARRCRDKAGAQVLHGGRGGADAVGELVAAGVAAAVAAAVAAGSGARASRRACALRPLQHAAHSRRHHQGRGALHLLNAARKRTSAHSFREDSSAAGAQLSKRLSQPAPGSVHQGCLAVAATPGFLHGTTLACGVSGPSLDLLSNQGQARLRLRQARELAQAKRQLLHVAGQKRLQVANDALADLRPRQERLAVLL